MSVIPLESNPDVINKFLKNMGVPEKWQVTDVYGLDEDMLAIVPRPVLSLMLLFPTSQNYEDHCVNENANIEEKGQKKSSNIYYMKQYLHNACGTVAVIHSVANNLSKIQLNDGCLKDFLFGSTNLSPEERGELLQKHEGIIEAHKAVASEGQTGPPRADSEVDYHFIAFVCCDGQLYELDGERPFPIARGSSSPETLLEDAARVIKEFMARDPDNVNFSLMALTSASD
uniref:Ubiquitin carboxyl-terminal hydrolase n=1 Tax=Graphocephala atropunctata TaxID=36148 RepID=A0A1B6LCB9_9HEMI